MNRHDTILQLLLSGTIHTGTATLARELSEPGWQTFERGALDAQARGSKFNPGQPVATLSQLTDPDDTHHNDSSNENDPMRPSKLREMLAHMPVTEARRTVLAHLIELGHIRTREILGSVARFSDTALVAFIEGVAPDMLALSKAKNRDDDQEDDDDDEECDEDDGETMKRLAKFVACVSHEKLEKAVEKKKRDADADAGVSDEDLKKIADANRISVDELKKAMRKTHKASVTVDGDTIMGRGLREVEKANRLALGVR